MTVLSGKTIRRLGIISPHHDRTVVNGMTYGESLAGYDIRLGEFEHKMRIFVKSYDNPEWWEELLKPELERDRTRYIPSMIDTYRDSQGFYEKSRHPFTTFGLGVSVEYFKLPNNVIGIVHDKSSWARKGITVQNTVIEPGWEGYLTLEIVNHKNQDMELPKDCPIAQVVFHYVDEETKGYKGKYQNQPPRPVEAKYEYPRKSF